MMRRFAATPCRLLSLRRHFRFSFCAFSLSLTDATSLFRRCFDEDYADYAIIFAMPLFHADDYAYIFADTFSCLYF